MKLKNVETLPEAQRAAINEMFERLGIERTRTYLGPISRHALERAAGGLSVRRGTVAYLTQKLAERQTIAGTAERS